MQKKYQKGSLGKRALSVLLTASMVLAYNPAAAIAIELNDTDATVQQSSCESAITTESVDYTTMTPEEIEAYEAAVEAQSDAEAAANYSFQLASTVTVTTGTIECANGWKLDYSITEGAGATITSVNVAGSGALTIPSTIEGENVVAIGTSAFKKCTALTKVTIPSTVKTIGDEAFRGTGLTTLTIPEGVTTLGKSAIRECASLTSCTLPNTLTSWGSYCFKSDTALTSINIPASLDRVPYSCFELCSALKDVNFEGDTMRYIHRNAFENCTSLESITLPLLTEYPNATEARAEGLISYTDFNYCIGMNCFFGDTNLSLIVCKGPVLQDGKSYFAAAACLSGCASDISVVFECASSEIGYGTTGRVFHVTGYDTLDFYNSEEDAANLTNRVTSYTVRTSRTKGYDESEYGENDPVINLISMLNGTKDYSQYRFAECTSTIPEAPEGKVWGVINHPKASSSSSGMSSSSTYYNSGTKFYSSYQVAAVDPENLNYAWVESPSTRSFYEAIETTSTSSSSSYPTLYRNNDGIVEEAADFSVHAADDSVLDSSAYTLDVDQAIVEYQTNVRGVIEEKITGWESTTMDDLNEAGIYRIRAKGTGEYEGTVTEYTYFYVDNPVPDTTSYYNADDQSLYLGTALTNAARTAYEDNDSTAPNYQVITSSTDWRAQLLGAGFAGATPNNAIILQNTGDSFSSKMAEAFVQSGAKRYLILGDQSAVPQSEDTSLNVYLADDIDTLATNGGYRFGADATTAQSLATSAIGEFKTAAWGATWGSTAVVASSTQELATLTAIQYVYHNAAQVYFLDESGALSSDTLEALKSSSIENIVVVGDESCVSDSVVSQIASATGKTPTRKFDSATATTDSIAYAREIVTEKFTANSSATLTVAIADASDPANVTAAASYAEATGGILLTCRSKADVRAIEKFFTEINAAYGNRCVENMEIIGEFSYLGSTTDDVETILQSAWRGGLSSYDLCAGDTFEVDGYIYQLLNGKAQFVEATDGVSESDVPNRVTYGDETYAVSTSTVYGITSEPTDVDANMDDEVTFSVSCNDEGAQYLWQMSSDGGKTWRTSGAYAHTSQDYVIMTTFETRNYLYRCVLTYSDGSTETSDVVSVNFQNQIYLQPENIEGSSELFGEVADYTVAAINASSYQWQSSQDNGVTWADYGTAVTGKDSVTIEPEITKESYNDVYRCLVTYTDGSTEYTNVVGISWANEILYQPEDASDLAVGDTVSFEIGVPRDATCQWQCSKDGSTWEDASYASSTTDTLTFQMLAELDGYQWRCMVTFADGTTTTSTTCTCSLMEQSNTIVTQPSDYFAHNGERAYFSLVAVDAVSYQWQYSVDGEKWYNSGVYGCKTNSLRVDVASNNAIRQYRCVVKFSDGSTKTSKTCTVLQDSQILVQPEDFHGTVGSSVYFKVSAENVLTYQWQFSLNGETWCNSGCNGKNKEKLYFPATDANIDRIYRCLITYKDGTQAYTDIVTVVQPSELVTPPSDYVAAVGQTAYLSLKATNVASYQWQYSVDGKNWGNSGLAGNKSERLTVAVTSGNFNRQYRCIIKFKDDTEIITDAVKVVSGAVLSQPENVVASAGDTVYFTTVTNDANATYQWQYSVDGKNWGNSGYVGNKSNRLKVSVTTGNISRSYRCLITFNDGTTAVTDLVKVVTA